jgi:hypothetical protein
MATRSRVGLELSNGSILSIYSHWDGYPEWAGRILRTHYNTYEKVAELIDGGDVSCLWTDEVWDAKRDANDDCTVKKYGPMYYSQRGEDCPPRLDNNIGEYLCDGEEYAYLFRNGEWVCYNMNQFEDDKLPEIVEIPKGALAV